MLGQASVRASFSSGPGAPHQEVTGSPLFPPLQRDALVSLSPPPGEAAAWPCRQVPTIPASKAGALLFPSLSAFFFTQPFHLFIYQVFTEYLLALGDKSQWVCPHESQPASPCCFKGECNAKWQVLNAEGTPEGSGGRCGPLIWDTWCKF